MLPDIPTEKIKFVGNTAITGAKMALISKETRNEAEQIAKKARYLELTSDPDFNQEFTKALVMKIRPLTSG